MGVTAENLAEKMGSRATSRTRSPSSPTAARRPRRTAGRFDEQIVPVPVKVKRETVDFDKDEHIRPDADAEAMAKLPSRSSRRTAARSRRATRRA